MGRMGPPLRLKFTGLYCRLVLEVRKRTLTDNFLRVLCYCYCFFVVVCFRTWFGIKNISDPEFRAGSAGVTCDTSRAQRVTHPWILAYKKSSDLGHEKLSYQASPSSSIPILFFNFVKLRGGVAITTRKDVGELVLWKQWPDAFHPSFEHSPHP